MKAILPLWKIQREWKRLKMQVGQIEWLVMGPLRKRAYDRNRARLVKVTQGDQALTPKVAIQLIWQPKGLLASFLEELAYFADRGFCTVLVSNAPLSDADIARLTPLCHLIVQRPNYGYDFGGYREGVLTLRDHDIRPAHLVIKNDSVWFPLWPDCDLLDRALTSQADLFGIYENELSRRPHLQSYFYHFGPRPLADPGFWSFWDKLWMTDNKYMVIRQCEMKLTQAFQKLGYVADSVFHTRDMRAALIGLNDTQLAEVLAYQVQVNTRSAPEVMALLGNEAEPGWRAAVEEMILRGRMGKYFLITHPSALYAVMACPVLKKDRQPMYQLQRRELVRIGLADQMRPTIRQEILDWDRG
jgi:hypothetical protein